MRKPLPWELTGHKPRWLIIYAPGSDKCMRGAKHPSDYWLMNVGGGHAFNSFSSMIPSSIASRDIRNLSKTPALLSLGSIYLSVGFLFFAVLQSQLFSLPIVWRFLARYFVVNPLILGWHFVASALKFWFTIKKKMIVELLILLEIQLESAQKSQSFLNRRYSLLRHRMLAYF